MTAIRIRYSSDDRRQKRYQLRVARGALLSLVVAAAILFQAASVKADVISDRSLSLSTNAKGATGVHYSLLFTAVSNDTNVVVVDFCRNSAAVGDTCEAVGGLDVSAVSTADSNTASRLSGQAVMVDLSTTVNTGEEVSVELTDIVNPYDPGVFYARIITYQTAVAAAQYQSTAPGTHLDDGAVTLSIIDGVDVGGAVLETLEFCTSGSAFDEFGCGGVLSEPDLALGGEEGLGLSLATAPVFTRVSTNAVGGAVISLGSNTQGCGGLARWSDSYGCDIQPLTTPGAITDGAARFGLRFGAISGGTGAITPAGDYSQANYFLHYEADDESGITSPFGDPIYTTNDAPLSGGEAELVFGANRSANTPAGNYSAKLTLLATGKF